MSIRVTVKALIVKDGCLLVNRCRDDAGGLYYDLPGGGQQQGETIAQALVREVMEETGWEVGDAHLAAVTETIYTDAQLTKQYPQYAHRLLLIFAASLRNEARQRVQELDYQQEDALWVPLAQADALRFVPRVLCGRISDLLAASAPVFLGSHVIAHGID